ncbi:MULTISPECIES: ester cyclase [unclassified Gilliamella]|uniref:nuclear transport factor 2 family protein n=1 Tax=unclassified Gilliamella TaxID=2685620 RepID=UPI002269FF24|nr:MULTISPECIES: ester cyclase [unclassified Gilliamella]MCX8656949.1 ester cyclase [Gilliamella sp. B2894]MCX8665031.1 ester cyclase [Gilliamella sp. B2887]MCX8694138.1 ester cyclase [Gilliamella sp. B2881]MCX8696872.1 ester cyclase [Gilliamella sp. B2828]MCX8697623.1 ester cyclase [Gilliamella sp. B3000]
MSIVKNGIIALSLLFISSTTIAIDKPSRDIVQEEKNRTLVINFYNDFFNKHQTNGAMNLLPEDYKQHNPYVPDGRAPFIAYFSSFFNEHPQSSARIIRTAVDGDLVWLHVHIKEDEKDPGKAELDIFRVKDGKIVEHWDVIQNIPSTAANSNTMF